VPRDLAAPHDPRVIDAARQAVIWLTPPASIGHARAAAADEAVALADRILAAILRAGAVDRPDDRLALQIADLRATLVDLADEARAWADDDEPEHAQAAT
jgi:hypothetical protein